MLRLSIYPFSEINFIKEIGQFVHFFYLFIFLLNTIFLGVRRLYMNYLFVVTIWQWREHVGRLWSNGHVNHNTFTLAKALLFFSFFFIENVFGWETCLSLDRWPVDLNFDSHENHRPFKPDKEWNFHVLLTLSFNGPFSFLDGIPLNIIDRNTVDKMNKLFNIYWDSSSSMPCCCHCLFQFLIFLFFFIFLAIYHPNTSIH